MRTRTICSYRENSGFRQAAPAGPARAGLAAVPWRQPRPPLPPAEAGAIGPVGRLGRIGGVLQNPIRTPLSPAQAEFQRSGPQPVCFPLTLSALARTGSARAA